MKKLLHWDIYEVNSEKYPLTGNMVRGRVRKFAIENKINLLVENTEIGKPTIRFAVLSGFDIKLIKEFLENLFDDVEIEKVLENIENPVLSKLQVNKAERYKI